MLQWSSKTKSSDGSRRRGLRRLAVLGGTIVTATAIWAQAAAVPGTQKPHRAHKPRAGQTIATPQAPVDATPPQPEMPKWPVNEAPTPPNVTWNSQGLRIQATNSSLSQILSAVSTQTGAKIEGASSDERVFGEYGPGTARDVLSQLLRGSDYDFLMLGDQGQGTPRQIILTARRNAAGNANHNNINPQQPQDQSDDDNAEPPEQPEEQQPPPQQFQPQQPPQQQPQQEPMTPQQRMQQMQQQRLQQMQQLQQQYQQQQQQQPQQPQPQ